MFSVSSISKDDRLPNLDATQQTADNENNEQVVVPTGERKHFPYNITKIGFTIFSVSYNTCPCADSYNYIAK